jgi:hypothetical protein
MFGLCLLLVHSEPWNLTSLIFIPLDLLGLVGSLWLIASAIKGILYPSDVSRNDAASRRASQHVASGPQLLTALLAKKSGARGPSRLAPESVSSSPETDNASGFPRTPSYSR